MRRRDAVRNAEAMTRQLAGKLGAKLSVGNEEVTALLSHGIWEFSDTEELIASRESGERMPEVWFDLLKQMEFGIR